MAPPLPIPPEDAALSLTMAMVASSPGPLLLLDGELNVVAASASFCAAFDIDRAVAPGGTFFALGGGEWRVPQIRTLLEATVSGSAAIDAYEMDLDQPGRATRRLIIQARKLAYVDLDRVRILVAVSDVTAARTDTRLKDEALARNGVLLKEIRHRVANSLQIIASVLLQNAKRTQSEETRLHLRDAHNRVMSVAALERLLSAAGEPDGEVQVHGYLRSLCESIAASMIADSDQISLTVADGAGAVASRVSVSLGLITTELVINALKHAFPDGRQGKISVSFEGGGPNWTLTVSDDGVGMPAAPERMHVGLGTSIIEALARQLRAGVEVAAGASGTTVRVEHQQLALVAEDAQQMSMAQSAGQSAA